jgi:hypothetical protein
MNGIRTQDSMEFAGATYRDPLQPIPTTQSQFNGQMRHSPANIPEPGSGCSVTLASHARGTRLEASVPAAALRRLAQKT